MNALGRTWLWIREQITFLVVLGVLIGAFAYLVADPVRWGRATGVVAVAVLLAGLLRGLVDGSRVGMLAVRGRFADTVCYLVLGGVLLGVDIRLHG